MLVVLPLPETVLPIIFNGITNPCIGGIFTISQFHINDFVLFFQSIGYQFWEAILLLALAIEVKFQTTPIPKDSSVCWG